MMIAKVHEELQGKPKGTCNTDYPSDDQKNLKHRNVTKERETTKHLAARA